ncbi:hypothetical protein WUBG_07338 [Wuchereria bancrofti]|uniref:Uncharacterized protein n=1 Tax=Wuchereria bancrofti TaxID=6293 RepID=J9F351_WUCBA|nr:hypothetical protein WUBG_07338 [Wuchereria bancrofti]
MSSIGVTIPRQLTITVMVKRGRRYIEDCCTRRYIPQHHNKFSYKHFCHKLKIFIEKENHSAIFAIFRYTNSAVHRVPITYLVLLALITVNIDITEVYVQDIHLSLRNMNFKNLRLGKLGLINRSVPIIVTQWLLRY